MLSYVNITSNLQVLYESKESE